MNELIFILHACTLGIFLLIALKWGQQALVTLIALQAVLANLFVLKQITLFGMSATASDAFAVGAGLGINLLQEFYGANTGTKAIKLSFGCLFFYAIMAQFQLIYQPNGADTCSLHYQALLAVMPRLALASLMSYGLYQWVNFRIFTLLQNRASSLPFATRAFITEVGAQLVDTVSFTLLGLYGVIANLGQVIMVSYAIKLTVLAISLPFMRLMSRLDSPLR